MPSKPPSYIGRFAPSPTGPLHLGSLYTALASFLDAKAHQGQWVLRIDDLDTPRNVPGAVTSILSTLDRLGLQWDGCPYFQSQQLTLYNDILQQLQQEQQVYPCLCSRKSLANPIIQPATEAIYPNHCRNNVLPCTEPHALRIKLDNRTISFNDRLQGKVTEIFSVHCGDFILKRKDCIIAYQFAVVIDDAQQQVNHIVRGIDLLSATPRQIYLQQLLNLLTPMYMHVPIIIDQHGMKLSKQTKAQAVDLHKPTQVLFHLLNLLKQQPPTALQNAPTTELINWAISHWNPVILNNIRTVSVE